MGNEMIYGYNRAVDSPLAIQQEAIGILLDVQTILEVLLDDEGCETWELLENVATILPLQKGLIYMDEDGVLHHG